jgi:Fe-S cluster biosynthesis and repair protein YggX
MADNEPRKPTKRTSRTNGTPKNGTPKKAKKTPPKDAFVPSAPEPTVPELMPASAAESATVPSAPSGPRMVQCAKLGRELPGLDRPPFPGELGRRIYEHISELAWEMWQDRSTLLINHYGLNLADPDARQILRQQMEEFFFGQDARMPEGWVPEGAGAKGKGVAAPRK